MKFINHFVIVSTIWSLCPVVSATTDLVFTEANGIEIGSLSVGTTSSVTLVDAGVAGLRDRDVVYTVDNIDIDADGIADSLSVVIHFTSTGLGTFDGNVTRSLGNGSFGINSANDSTGTIDLEGEELTIAFGAVSFDLSGGGAVPDVLLERFTEVSFRSYGAESRHILDGDTGTVLNANTTADNQVVDSDTVSIGFADADDPLDNDGFRIRDVSFTIEIDATIVAVPEPSLTAMFGLGGLVLLFRRRK